MAISDPRLSSTHFAQDLLEYVYARARASMVSAGHVDGRCVIRVERTTPVEFVGEHDAVMKTFLDWLGVQPSLGQQERAELEEAAVLMDKDLAVEDEEFINALVGSGMTESGKLTQNLRDAREVLIRTALGEQIREGVQFASISARLDDLGQRTNLEGVSAAEVNTILKKLDQEALL